MAGLSIQLMGPFYVTLGGKPVTSFEYDKVRALLAYLAVEQVRPHRREALAGMLWPDLAEEAAESNLRNALSRLRRAINDLQADPPYLIVNREEIQFNPASDHWLDIRRFNKLLEACEAHAHRRIEACSGCTDRLLEAANLYHGAFLEGFSLPDSEPFEDWLRIQREEHNELALNTLHTLALTYERRGELERALKYARRQLNLDPCLERAYVHAMKLYATLGMRAEACAQYAKCRKVLAGEIEVEPAQETTYLYEQIKYGLFQPSRGQLFQVNNLPTNLTSFVGREQELNEIRALTEDPACRLLSLVGPGGVGKTRLAIMAASQLLATFAHGACFVSLQGVASIEGIAPAIFQALEHKPASSSDLKKSLLDYLREKELMLVLDNFEHLLEGAGLITEMLQAAPGIMVLVTSRQRLGLQAEWVFEVSGLSCPPDKEMHELASYESVKLFTQRLHQFKPRQVIFQDDLASVGRICRLVEGLPLGIELAASAVKNKSIGQVVLAIESGKEELECSWSDVPERHRSMRAVFEHSYRMLKEDERSAFLGLGVFHSEFSAEAAEQVAGATSGILEALVEHSLVRYEAALDRYNLHELVRQYTRDRLAETSEKECEFRQRHAHYFMEALDLWGNRILWSEQSKVLKEMDPQQSDFMAAWDWVCQLGDLSGMNMGVRSIIHYYLFRLRNQGGVQACLQGLKVVEGIQPGSVLSKLIEVELLYYYFDLLEQRKLELFDEETKRRWERLFSLPGELEQDGFYLLCGNLAVLMMERSSWVTDIEEKLRLAQESVDLARRSGPKVQISVCLNNLTSMELYTGRISEAEIHCRESVRLWREQDSPYHLKWILSALSQITADLGKLEEAMQAAEESAQMGFSMHNPENTIDGLQVLGKACYYCRKWNEAVKYYAESLPYIQELGDRNQLCLTLASLGEMKLILGYYDEARMMAQKSYSLAAIVNEEQSLPKDNFILGGVNLAEGNYQQAIDGFEKAIGGYEPGWFPAYIEQARGAYSIGLCNVSEDKKACEQMIEALSSAMARHSYQGLSYALPASTLLLATYGRLEQAMELYGLICEKTIYGNTPWLEDVVGKKIKELAEGLPAEVKQSALERGKKLDLFETASELLEEFQAGAMRVEEINPCVRAVWQADM